MQFPIFSENAGPEPVTPVRATTRVVHGVTLSDPYAWLRAENWRDVLRDPAALPADIRSVLEAENAYAEALMAPTKDLQKVLLAEMRGRVREDDSDVPFPDGPFEYYDRYREGGEHELVCRKPLAGGDEEILLDGDALSKGKAFFSIGAAVISPDHRLLAWSADEKGSEFHTIRVRDVATGLDLPDVVPDADDNVVWNANSTAFYYVRLDENHRANRVFRHTLGEAPERDALVYEEADPAWFVHVHRSRSRRFCVIHITDHDSAEAWLVDLHGGDGAPKLVAPRERGVRYDVEPHGERLFIRTNAGGAEDFRIVETPLAAPGRENWRDVVPHRRGRLITGVAAYRDWLVRLEREDSLPRVVARDLASGEEHSISFAEEAYALSLDAGREFDTATTRFTYSSLTTPRETFDYDMASRARVSRKRQSVPSGHDPADYVTRRLFAPSPDGELIPVTLLHRKETKLDGSAPLFISGYGAYGIAFSASFGTSRLSLVDRGFVYAIAHVRGGTDKGWAWYENGKLAKKKNTFGDFIAATRFLIDRNITSAGRVVASSASAGGMLMGAIANMAPELFAGLVADVPFVDVVNTMLDADLPLTPPEWLEWGNPIEDPEAFATMLAYSPYDNVANRRYPAILAPAGLTDPRVTYWEPAKWIARLRATGTGGPFLLKTNMDAGHGGASGRFDSLKDTAFEYAFALACVGARSASA